MLASDLYSPPDVDDAHAEWGANCGPCALAAVLRRSVESVRPLFPNFGTRRYVNPTHMKDALAVACVPFRSLKVAPGYGLLFLQIDGPWCAKGVPVAAAYRHTHWIAYAKRGDGGPMVYDVNAREWWEKSDWEADVVPALLEATPRATGYWARSAIEVKGVA